MAGPSASVPLGAIAGYRILGKIGAGGMGVVYKALDLKLDRTVALKFVAEEGVSAEDRERLLREARAASSLDHPNIATVHSVGETDDGRLFLDMAYYEGETLGEKLRHGPLQQAKAIDIACQIARGLQHAHQHDVVHRDIKPSNVILTADGTAKIVDFGLARMYGANASTESATLTGTLYYMSPEQAQGRALDARTDLWSLGVVLYQMVTGRLPFHAESAGSTLVAIIQSAPAAMGNVPEEVQLVILRALSKEPAARYQSAGEMLAELQRLAVDDRALTAQTSSNLQRELKRASEAASPARPRMAYRPLIVAVLLCAMAGIGLALLVNPLRARLFGPEEKHIAVLPFEAPANDVNTQNLADGLMESIAGKLSNLNSGEQSLWVVPSSEIRKRKIDDPAAARRELGATIAVKGKVQPSGDGIRLVVDVIDAKSLRLLGSAAIAKSTASLAMVDDEAVEKLAGILHVAGAPAAAPPEATRLGSAYESYLKGRGLLQRFDRAGNLDAAITLLQSALNVDPSFALASAAIGEAYWYKFRMERDPQWLKKATEYCDRAVSLNAKLPAVYVMLGRVHDSGGQHDLALADFQQALQLDPRNADAMLGLASVYETLGRTADAEGTIKKAVALRPDYWLGVYELAVFYQRQHRGEDALREFRRVVELAPDSAQAHSNLAAGLQRLAAAADDGQRANIFREAEAELRKSLSINENYAAYANLGMLYYRQKRWADSAAMTEKALQLNANNYLVWANLGITYEWLNEREKASAAYGQELAHLLVAAQLNADDPQMQCELAVLYSKQKQREPALRHLDNALARSPKDRSILSGAAEVYENLGDRARALDFVRRSMANGRTLTELQENPGLRAVLNDARFAAMAQQASPSAHK